MTEKPSRAKHFVIHDWREHTYLDLFARKDMVVMRSMAFMLLHPSFGVRICWQQFR